VTGTYTSTRTFTITHARYVTSKVAADLHQLRLFYGSPADSDIEDYAEEAALLLRDGYLERVDYGFKREDSVMGSQWVLLLRYTARDGVLDDDHAGRVPPAVNIAGARFWSFLSYSGRYFALSEAERERVKAALPIQRTAGREAGFVTGTWSGARTYSAADQGIARSVFRAL
jgi:Bacterial HORMA domain family 1